LASRFDRRLTVVVAGAGYGKTTLLAQAVAENRFDPGGIDLWLQVVEADRTPAYLVAALAEALTGNPDAAADVEGLCSLVLLRAPESVAFLLDDAHLLDGSPSWALLEELLDAMPRNGHLVLGTRTFPTLSVRRRQTAGEAELVDEAALAFTEAELTDLASALGARPEVVLPTWPALAVLTGTAGHDASIGYLWEEILGELPPERRRALALVSRLERFDDELVVAAAGAAWTAAALVDDLPLVDSAGDSHRLHDLWRVALADVVPPEDWRRALMAAAQVHLARGEIVRATVLLRDAGEVEAMMALARKYLSLPISARLSRAEAQVMYDLLPAAEQDGPVGLGLASVLLWTPGEVELALAQMHERSAAVGDDEMRSLTWWRRVQLQGDTDPGALVITDELAALAEDGWPLARSAVALARSCVAQQDRDVETALAVLEDLHGPDPQTRRVALASRYLALGRPELVPTTLADVLAEGVTDPVAAQAVWFRGDVTPEDAWTIAAPLPAAYGARRLAAVEVPLLSMVAAVAVSVGALSEARALADTAVARRHLVARRLAVFADVADALVALGEDSEDGEDAFLERLRAATEIVPLGRWPAWGYLGALAPIRALLPSAAWMDDLPLGPSMTVAVAAGRAVAELRSGRGRATAAGLPWAATSLLRAHVPPAMLCELALAVGDEEPEAAALLDATPTVSASARRLVDHPDSAVAERAAAMAAQMPIRPPYDLRISTFGGLGVARSDGMVLPTLERRHRMRQLLARLVVERSVPRATVAAEMWPDLAVDQAANNLRVTLAKLLAVVEPDRVDGRAWWIRTVGERLELAGEGLSVDADDFDRHLRDARAAEAQGAPSVAYDHYLTAVEGYVGEFLPDVDQPWAVHERLRLQSLGYAAACRLAEFEVARGEPEVAMDHATAAIRIDDLGERAYRLMIGCHLALGATDAARQTAELLAERQRSAGVAADVDLLRAMARVRGGTARR
jgi:DNA-binding SARP family transcriptional activator